MTITSPRFARSTQALHTATAFGATHALHRGQPTSRAPELAHGLRRTSISLFSALSHTRCLRTRVPHNDELQQVLVRQLRCTGLGDRGSAIATAAHAKLWICNSDSKRTTRRDGWLVVIDDPGSVSASPSWQHGSWRNCSNENRIGGSFIRPHSTTSRVRRTMRRDRTALVSVSDSDDNSRFESAIGRHLVVHVTTPPQCTRGSPYTQ